MPRPLLSGTVVSDRMQKTIIVLVRRLAWHQRLKMHYYKRKRIFAHDEFQQCRMGDKVTIESFRPLSKNKAFVLKSIDYVNQDIRDRHEEELEKAKVTGTTLKLKQTPMPRKNPVPFTLAPVKGLADALA
eukprot:TRINITY_DN13548_c0_g1_i1.p1 TRINITY_DN13548_c0_g1~~TRINITY_DN13548_c0_g1_i1.p1  ORF type:complete len:143 (-),score=12.29 TRINITY_DN13548_c0_g1_i1:139-528(-)